MVECNEPKYVFNISYDEFCFIVRLGFDAFADGKSHLCFARSAVTKTELFNLEM